MTMTNEETLTNEETEKIRRLIKGLNDWKGENSDLHANDIIYGILVWLARERAIYIAAMHNDELGRVMHETLEAETKNWLGGEKAA